MTTELTQPQSELGPVPANGQGQSQGHRRRRRRRKNKSSQASGAVPSQPALQAQPPQAEPPAQPQRPLAAKHKPAPQHQGGHQGGRQGGHQNQGRKKKKFIQKGSAAQPGNSISASPQAKRKAKQKGPREFVGPMDHSYRLVNGNIADGPPSTIPTGSNGHNGGYYPEAYDSQPTAAVREDAPTRIYCFIEDMFFLAKIQETARKLGVKVEFVKNGDKDAMLATLAELPENERPKLLVFDLNNLNAKPLTLIPKFKAKLKKATSIIGFLNH